VKVLETELPGVSIIEPVVHGDSRGFLLESWHARRYAEHGLPATFVQDNHSRSLRGVLRGLHYQLRQPQGKLVRVVSGEVFDVVVDIRRGSPAFGRWVGVMLTGENHRQLYVPPGFAHGFCVVSDVADFLYKCTDYYAPEDEHGIRWDDPDIGVEWPNLQYSLSEKDERHALLAELDAELPVYEGSA
jgi:dTDP-4-dehydrorhamnose 3,5-epimerase